MLHVKDHTPWSIGMGPLNTRVVHHRPVTIIYHSDKSPQAPVTVTYHGDKMKDENIVALLHGEKHLDKIQNTFLIKTPHQIRYRAIHLNIPKATLTQQRKLESLVSMIWNKMGRPTFSTSTYRAGIVKSNQTRKRRKPKHKGRCQSLWCDDCRKPPL